MNWTLIDSWMAVATSPAIVLQSMLFTTAFVLVFLVLYTTRDIILRTHSFLYQMACIVLVAVLPFVGFFVYLLIRPGKTLSEKKMLHLLHEIAGKLGERKGKMGK